MRIRSVLFSALALFLLGAQTAQACSCVKRSDIQMYRDASFVFVGVVSDAQRVTDPRYFGGGYVLATAEVRERLKGETGGRFSVVDELPQAGVCPSYLELGREYVFFVSGTGKVDACSGTRPLDATRHNRAAKLQALRELQLRAER